MVRETGGESGARGTGEFTRRTALMSTAGLATLAGCTVGESDDPDTLETTSSGTPGDVREVTKESPLVDVRAYGVVGDGETDDAAALQRAVDAATPHGVLYVPSDLVVRFESPIDIDLGIEGEAPFETANRFAFICEGALRPAGGLGNAITLKNGLEPYVSLRVDGGGSVTEPLDGGAGAIADTDTALRVTGVRGGYVEGFANRYGGTVVTFDSTVGNTANSSIGFLKAYDCGQAILFRNVYGLGGIGNVWDRQPIRCPAFVQSWDISLNQYENIVADTNARTPSQGLRFDTSGSIWIDKLALGGSSPHLDSLLAFQSCEGAQVNTLFANVAANTGVNVDSSTFVYFGRIYARQCGIGLRVTESPGGKFPTRAVRANLDARNCDRPFAIENGVTGDNIWITGTMSGYKQPARIAATDPDFVRIADAHFDSHQASVPELALADGTSVHIQDSVIPEVEGQPKTQGGVGTAAADAETPDPSEWNTGDIVEFTDTGDGSGDGVYLKLPDSTWTQIGSS
jgi:hypothetical protein